MTRLILLALLALPLSAQVFFDPDPNEPYAAWTAEHRYLVSEFYGGPPPIGWICSSELVEVDHGLWLPDALCYPDPEAYRRQRDAELENRRALTRAVRSNRRR